MTRVWLCGSAKGKITEERIQRSLCTDFSSLLCNCVYCCHQLSSLTTNTRQDTTKRRKKNLLLVRLWNKTMIHHFMFSRLWDPCTTIEGHGLPVCVCVCACLRRCNINVLLFETTYVHRKMTPIENKPFALPTNSCLSNDPTNEKENHEHQTSVYSQSLK